MPRVFGSPGAMGAPCAAWNWTAICVGSRLDWGLLTRSSQMTLAGGRNFVANNAATAAPAAPAGTCGTACQAAIEDSYV